jgi:hypothetical protein
VFLPLRYTQPEEKKPGWQKTGFQYRLDVGLSHKKRNPVGKKPGFSIDDIVKNRLKQKRREELLEAVRESREAFKRGDVKSGTVAELMEELKD